MAKMTDTDYQSNYRCITSNKLQYYPKTTYHKSLLITCNNVSDCSD